MIVFGILCHVAQKSQAFGDLQYASVVYLHSAVDRDDSRWYFEKVQVLSAKLSDANGTSSLIAKTTRMKRMSKTKWRNQQ